MVFACGMNGGVSYGQEGVDGGSKWKAGTRETELGWLDGVNVAWTTEE